MKPQSLNEVLDDIDEMLGNLEDLRDTPHGPAPNSYMELRRALRDARAHDAARAASMVQALKIACAALHSMPPVGGAYQAEHRTAHAFALVNAQAAVGMAEGAPFDGRAELVVTLNSARDALEYLLPRVDLCRAGGREMRRAERALVDLMRLVGPGPVERRIQAWVDAYAGVERPRQSADVTPVDVELYSHR